VRSFKQVAVDQSSDDIRSFNMKAYLDEVLLSLQPRLRGRPVKMAVDCPDDVALESFPGAVSQIVTTLVINSLVHGYAREEAGSINMVTGPLGGSVKVDSVPGEGLHYRMRFPQSRKQAEVRAVPVL
jgi:hypothetical protein